MDDDKIEKQIELAAEPARVWRAIADYEEFGKWFRATFEGPFRLGEVTRGRSTYPGCEHMRFEVRVERIEPERLFAISWHPQEADIEELEPDAPTTLVEFRLEPTAKGTLLTVTESGFAALPDPERFECMRRNEAGWEEQMTNIKNHIDA